MLLSAVVTKCIRSASMLGTYNTQAGMGCAKKRCAGGSIGGRRRARKQQTSHHGRGELRFARLTPPNPLDAPLPLHQQQLSNACFSIPPTPPHANAPLVLIQAPHIFSSILLSVTFPINFLPCRISVCVKKPTCLSRASCLSQIAI